MSADLPTDADLDGFPVVSGNDAHVRDELELILSRFCDEVRRGARPALADYMREFPQWAEEIRELFPLVASLERWKADKEVEQLRTTVPATFPLDRVGQFRLVRELGRGGMGIVFVAEHEATGKRAAIKLLPWRIMHDRPHFKARFREEAATIARLRHRHIVRVYAFGVSRGYCYYVMSLIQGASLDRVIHAFRSGIDPVAPGDFIDDELRDPTAAFEPPFTLSRESWRAFAQIALETAEAVAFAHASGVIHHDIKPANLLIKANGQVVMTDFGGLSQQERSVEAVEGPQVGTLRYMSPERLQGEVDFRSDVYALGVSLYELCTQRPAFSAENRLELVEQILRAAPVAPRALAPRIPRGLETIILNAMSPGRDERYPSAADMAADLRRFLKGEPVASLRTGLVQKAWRWYRGGPSPPGTPGNADR